MMVFADFTIDANGWLAIGNMVGLILASIGLYIKYLQDKEKNRADEVKAKRDDENARIARKEVRRAHRAAITAHQAVLANGIQNETIIKQNEVTQNQVSEVRELANGNLADLQRKYEEVLKELARLKKEGEQ